MSVSLVSDSNVHPQRSPRHERDGRSPPKARCGRPYPGTDDRDLTVYAATGAPGLAEHSEIDAVDRFVVGAYRRAWDAGRYAR